MIGRKRTIGLTALLALVACAIAAPGASAGTTAYECKAGKAPSGYEDSHCDSRIGFESKVNYIHEGIKAEITTGIEVTNEKTKNFTKEAEPAIFRSTVGAGELEIVCNAVAGTGNMANEPNEPKGVRYAYGDVTLEYSKCTVPKPFNQGTGMARCGVSEPIKMTPRGVTVGEEGWMGVKFFAQNTENKIIGTISLTETSECTSKGPYNVTGSIIGTLTGKAQGEGATLKFLPEISELTLGLFKVPATLESTVTTRLKSTGNALTLTTVNP
jgi:hypothetical protein